MLKKEAKIRQNKTDSELWELLQKVRLWVHAEAEPTNRIVVITEDELIELQKRKKYSIKNHLFRQVLLVISGLAFIGLAIFLAFRTMPPTPATETGETRMAMAIASQAFRNGERIPARYTCDGEDISPPLSWSGAPKETKTYALIMDDPDAPGGVFTHWVIFNMPASETSLLEDVPKSRTLASGAVQGRNDFGRNGYGGPCPPSGTHRYRFHLYALDTQLDLSPTATKHDVLRAIKGHVLAEGELTGLYSRR